MNGQHQQLQNPTPQHPQRDANNPAGWVKDVSFSSNINLKFLIGLIISEPCFLFASLLAIAEEALAEFLSKATGTAVDWVQMIGMKVQIIKVFVVFLCM